ncbi:MAG: NFACT RNA binding domain-containing protein, partial [Anaerovoracaceae bacterium]
MAFDGIVTGAIATELSNSLTNGKIEKVYQPEKDELIFQVHSPRGKKKVYLSCNNNHAGIFLTEDNYTNPQTPLAFCMLLRKHLQGGRIVCVKQKDTERIIELDFETRDELGFTVNKRLIIEIMGKHSNIILVDMTTGKIMDSIKRISIDVNRARQILPGQRYEYPPTQEKLPFNKVDAAALQFLSDAQESTDSATLILERIQGISPLIARALASAKTPQAIADRLLEISQQITSQQLFPTVYLKEEATPVDFHVLPIAEYDDRYQKLSFDTVSETVSYYYTHRNTSNRVKQKSSDLEKTIGNTLKKAYLKKQRLLEDLQKAASADKYQLYGELLTASLHQIKTGDASATVMNYYTQEEVTIPLDIRFAPPKNAQLYFKKYSKAKRSIKEKNTQLEETEKDIEYLDSVLGFIDQAGTTDEIDAIREELYETGFLRNRKKTNGRTKKGKAEPFRYVSSTGLPILAGRNNKENDFLTFKSAGRKDLWFHTKDIPGSHVILFVQGDAADDQSIFEAAAVAAYHSKGKGSENVPVDYTEVRYVK